MYRHIDRNKLGADCPDTETVQKEARHYLENRRVYDELRRAYIRNDITRQELLTLRGQVKAGDPDAAIKGLGGLLMKRVR